MIHKGGSGPRPWRARGKDQFGKLVQQSFRTKQEAEAFERDLADKRARARAGLPLEQGHITYGELAEKWKANNPPSEWRKLMLKYGEDRWGDVKVRLIEPEALGAWLHALPYAAKTKTHILDSMRQVLNAGVEWGYLTRTPARRGAFKAPGVQRVDPINPLQSWDEVVAVANCFERPGESALVRFVCATGLTSPSEWVEARWRDVNLKDREMIVHGTKTENRPRTIPLSARAIEALNDLPRGLPATRLFVGRAGGRFDYPNWRKSQWADALAAAGLEYRSPNQMRHTFATLALQAGARVEAVSKVMGHGDITITLRFYRKWTRPMFDGLRDVLDTINAEETDEKADSLGR